MERWWRHDRAAAQRAFLRAIRLEPRQPFPHGAYAWFLIDSNRGPEAIREARRSYELDPFSVSNSLGLTEILLEAGDTASAARQAGITLALDPTYGPAWAEKAYVLIARGRAAEAAALMAQHLSSDFAFDWSEGVLGEALARAGRATEARALARRMEERAHHQWVQPMSIAGIYAALGDAPHALDWLEEAERRGALEPQLDAEPEYRALHGEPRYQRLLRSLGLP
jgi:tetratricopeptide (TPR) repeat protein